MTISRYFPRDEAGELMIGKLGAEYPFQKAFLLHNVVVFILLIIKQACGGDLSKCKKVIKLGGFVNSTADFTGQPEIVNGASNLMVDVFGEEVGMHARAAVGMSSLPLGVAVEIDAEVEIDV